MEEPTLQWYALKVFYNKVFEMEDLLEGMGLETYLAVEKVQLKGEEYLSAKKKLADHSAAGNCQYVEEGLYVYKRVPLVSSLLFVRAEVEQMTALDHQMRSPDYAGKAKGFIYRKAEGRDFAVIPNSQMQAFRLVVESGASGLAFFADDDFTRYRKGDKVRVTDGPLKGVEGYIKRIRKDRRLLVCIEGIIAVATSYIPPEQLEKVCP